MTKLLPVCCALILYAAYSFGADSSPYSGAHGGAFANGNTGYSEIDRSTNPGIAGRRTGSTLQKDLWQIRHAAAADDHGLRPRAAQQAGGLAYDLHERAGALSTSLAELSAQHTPPLPKKSFLAARKAKNHVSLRECSGYATNVCPANFR